MKIRRDLARSVRRVPVGAFAIAAAVTVCVAAPASADVFSDIRYTDLVARLGAAVPTGAGVGVMQIEAPESGSNYAPDQTLPEFAGKTFTLQSGTFASSWHASEVGRALYGSGSSVAPGVPSIFVWNANGWLGSAYLRVGSSGTTAPLTPPAGVRVMNHSWIGSFGNTTFDNDGLRRLDYLIVRDNMFVTTGVNNGAGNTPYALMSYGYNALAVGLDTGAHAASPAPSGIDGQGRRKPDIVAPGSFTSFSTPVVGAVAALLWDTADSDPAVSSNTNAFKALTLKSVIMAGARHPAGWTNGAPTSGANRGFTGTPLDATLGVGIVNVDRAHMIFTAGERDGLSSPSSTVFSPARGWDWIAAPASGGTTYHSFRVNQAVDEVSVVAAWNRSVPLGFTAGTVMDVDLKLKKWVNGSAVEITGDAGASVFGGGNCVSASTIDNAEHLYLTNLSAGDYLLEITRKAGTQTTMPVVVSWYMPVTQRAADLNGDGTVGAADLALLLGQWGLTGSGDLNSDGVVGAPDLALLLGDWG